MSEKKILLVDDNPKITAIATHLEKIGFTMFIASDGHKALEIIKSEKPNLVLLDMEMPGMDGLQVLRIIKSEHKDTKVFVLTSHGMEFRKKAEKIGLERFFDKDAYTFNELEDAIKDVFSMGRVKEKQDIQPSGKKAKARLLFIEPSIELYSFTAGLFNNPEFCTDEYEKKAIYSHDMDDLSGIILSELMNQPDIVLINDYAMTEGQILNTIDLIRGVKIQPKEIIIHGLFARSGMFETQLELKKVRRCLQSPMAHQELIDMNEKLINFVNVVCVKYGLVKE